MHSRGSSIASLLFNDSGVISTKESYLEDVTLADFLDPLNRTIIIELVRDYMGQQNGCRLIQKFLQEKPLFSAATVAEAIIPDLKVHATDPYGNYVCQRLIDVSSETLQCRFMSVLLSPENFKILFSNLHGSCVLGAIISACRNPTQRSMILEAAGEKLNKMIYCSHGSTIIQLCLDTYESGECQTVYDYVERNFLGVSTDRYGCCVVKKCISCTDYTDSNLESIVLSNARELAMDQYGNYVLQHCMEAPHGKSQTKCADHVLQLFNDLLFHKHGSNVLEKALDCASKDTVSKIIDDLIILQPSLIREVMIDQYANYVLQKIGEHSSPSQRHAIKPLIEESSLQVKPNVRRRLEVLFNT